MRRRSPEVTAWGFPCGPDIDANIEQQARLYVGDHTAANGTVVTGSYNPQVEGVGADQIFVTLNQSQWWSGSFSDPTSRAPPARCASRRFSTSRRRSTTRRRSWELIPLFPDIKRKARVEIQEIAGLTGLLPIAVRVAAAAERRGRVLQRVERLDPRRQALPVRVQPDSFRRVSAGVPAGLGQWTTEPAASDPSPSWATFNVAANTGVVIATSFRPACGAGTPPATAPCLEDLAGSAGRSTTSADRPGTAPVLRRDRHRDRQTVASGVDFIHGYGTPR